MEKAVKVTRQLISSPRALRSASHVPLTCHAWAPKNHHEADKDHKMESSSLQMRRSADPEHTLKAGRVPRSALLTALCRNFTMVGRTACVVLHLDTKHCAEESTSLFDSLLWSHLHHASLQQVLQPIIGFRGVPGHDPWPVRCRAICSRFFER